MAVGVLSHVSQNSSTVEIIALNAYYPSQLVFHPEHRITVDEALEHAYLADLHGQVKLNNDLKSMGDLEFSK